MALQRVETRLNNVMAEKYRLMPKADRHERADDLELCNYKTEQTEKPYNPMQSLKMVGVTHHGGAMSIGLLGHLNKRNQKYF